VTGEYVVVPGDTLSALSQTLLGDGDLYPTLLEMNQDQIEDADLLIPGQVLRIPVDATG
jgi:nucleoid-associated protein YgaU